MRTLMVMKWAGVTPEQYETLRKTVNWEGNVPKGAVFHVAAFTENGILVTDIWDSTDDFQKFVQSRLMPEAASAGIKGQPQIEFYSVHALFVPDRERLV